ncbi:MAG: molybdopterin-dependent oxidoreductase [Kofleriaceae bacterium]
MLVRLVVGACATVIAAGCARGPSTEELERLRAEAVAADGVATAAHADERAAEPGQTLTIAGDLDGLGATLAWADLDRMATTHVRTVSPQNPTARAQVIDFRGVLVRDLLDAYRAAATAREVTLVSLDGFRSTVDVAAARRYRVLLAVAADGQPIARASGGPIFLVFPHSEAPETVTQFPDRYWSFYVTHLIVGTEPARLRVGQRVFDAAALAALPTVTRDGPVAWKTHWPATPVHLRGVELAAAVRAAGVALPAGGRIIVRGKAAIHRDPADPIEIAVDDLARCGFVLALRWGADEAPVTARLGGPIALAVGPACSARYGDRYWLPFVEELVVEPGPTEAP